MKTTTSYYLQMRIVLSALKIVSGFYKSRESDEEIVNEIAHIENDLAELY